MSPAATTSPPGFGRGFDHASRPVHRDPLSAPQRGRGVARADHRRDAELSSDDGRVGQHPADIRHECADAREHTKDAENLVNECPLQNRSLSVTALCWLLGRVEKRA